MKINRIILGFEKCLIVILLTFMFTVTFAQVIARYIFDTGWTWVPEMVVFACITLTYLGASTGVKSGVHIGVDVIVKLLPVRFQRYSDVFADFCGLVLYLFMAYISLLFVLYFREMGQQSLITGVLIWIMICYMPVGFFLMAVHHTESLWGQYKGRKQTEMESTSARS